MEVLLRDLVDHEFVYWCIDDRFPIAIYDLATIVAAMKFGEELPSEVDAIRISGRLRCDRAKGAFDSNDAILIKALKFHRRSILPGFYMPQFLRVSLLRWHFLHPSFPEYYSVYKFHKWLAHGADSNLRIYAPEKFLLQLGEATIGVRLPMRVPPR